MATNGEGRGKAYFLVTSVAALGVVFGDIGTSPLYALRESLNPDHGVGVSNEAVLGVLSLIVWALILIVTIKYLAFVLRADNEGEGGILSLLALVHPTRGGRRGIVLVLLGLFGASLLYGDGMITPAISVLSAMEGLEVASPAFAPYVIPLTIAVLVGLFLIQKHGTATIGRLFGPVMIVWFSTLALLGVQSIVQTPEVIAALNPIYGATFLATNGIVGFLVLGSVFLAVTGTEALYADMGHFGRGPIQFTWLVLVFPALTLNYFGQGALLLRDPSAIAAPFYLLAPEWALLPMVALATMATIIASQAIISGAFSVTMQAVQLGYWPRLDIRHTSEHEIGQIYVPPVNWSLMLSTIALVLAFRSSSGLAGAYGIAVSLDMVITSCIFFAVATQRWKWRKTTAGALVGFFLVIELAFLAANLTKVADGGWFPLVLAAFIFVLMHTWQSGRRLLGERLRERSKPIGPFLDELQLRGPTRVRGNAVYMTGNTDLAPPALVKNLEHNRVLHMQVILLSIVTEDVPYVPRPLRVSVEPVKAGVYRATARYGFMDEPDAVDVLRLLKEQGLDLPLEDTTFFLGRERLISSNRPAMAGWRERLFGYLARNALPATAYFRIPPDRVVEVGSQVEI